MAVSADFRKAMDRNKEAQKRFKESKKARPGDFAAPEIDDGRYIARVSAEAGKTPNQAVPYVRIRWMIVTGEYAKTSWMTDFYLEGKNEEQTQRNWDQLSKAIQVLADISDEQMEEFENWSMADLCDVIDEIDANAPLCKVRLKNWKGEKSSGLNCIFLELVDADDVEIETSEEDEEKALRAAPQTSARAAKNGSPPRGKAPTKTEEATGDDDDASGDDTDGDGGDEPQELAKGDKVLHKPKGKRSKLECEIVSVNKAKEEYTLKEVDNPKNKHTAIAWADCEPVVSED